MYKLLTNTVKETLCYAFQIWHEVANNDLKHFSYYILEKVLTKMAQRGALKDKFKRNL